MRVRISCPIFDSPTNPYGCAYGQIDIPAVPASPGAIHIPGAQPELTDLGFPNPMAVSVYERRDGTHLSLYGVVAADRPTAIRIARIMSEKLGWTIEEFEP